MATSTKDCVTLWVKASYSKLTTAPSLVVISLVVVEIEQI